MASSNGTPFFGDLLRAESEPQFYPDDVEPLELSPLPPDKKTSENLDPSDLSSSLLDFLIYSFLKDSTLDPTLIVGCSAICELMRSEFGGGTPGKNPCNGEEYREYGSKRFQFVACCNQASHCYVVTIVFDLTQPKDRMFEKVEVYAREKSKTWNRQKKGNLQFSSQDPEYFLCLFQKFLAHFCCEDEARNTLLQEERLILKKMKYMPNPLQIKRACDMGLTCLCVLFYVFYNIPLHKRSCPTPAVADFRLALYDWLNKLTPEVLPEKILECFPNINRSHTEARRAKKAKETESKDEDNDENGDQDTEENEDQDMEETNEDTAKKDAEDDAKATHNAGSYSDDEQNVSTDEDQEMKDDQS